MNSFSYEDLDLTPKFIHVSELEDVYEAKKHLAAALESLYGDSTLDLLEHNLEEAFAYLGMPFPDGQLKVEKP